MRSTNRAAMIAFTMLTVSLYSRAQSGDVLHPVAATGIQSTATPVQQVGQMKVICKGDQLTISANGSSLSTILSEVSRCSGAKIDGAEAATKMRFFETIGPAPIQEVLSSLLDASGMNYVIQVADANPRKIATIMLLARADNGSSSDLTDNPSLSSGRRAFLKQLRQNSGETEQVAPVNEPAASADTSVAENPSSSSPDPTPAPLEPPPTSTARVPIPTADSTPASSQMNLQDRIADMQRMFEQRKQMVQEQKSVQH
jgi:hypothetical protein